MSEHTERATAWIYQGIWRVIVRWLRVPDAPPSLPTGSAADVKSFRPSDGFLRYLKLKFWIALVVIDVILTGLWIALIVAAPLVGVLVTPLALALIVLPDVVAYVAIHLKYDTTWYVLSDRSLRIRRGIWTIRETTLTYSNIQNVKVVQGPLERYFGIANVIVETAGGGGKEPQHGGSMGPHTGQIVGVGNASEIRELIMRRSAVGGSSGLGDWDEPMRDVGGRWSSEHVKVLREIAAAVRKGSINGPAVG